jgi:hypothetical protein
MISASLIRCNRIGEIEMKKLLIGLSLLALSATASAGDFFGGNDGEWKMGPYGPYYEESDWPEWTPMYWMDEMMNSFDDDEDFGGGDGFMGGMPFMGNNNNYPMMAPQGMPMGYGAAPMGVPPMMAPQGMPMGYGAAPMGVPPMMAPQGMPMMPPQMAAPMMAPQGMPTPVAPMAPGATPGPAAN